MKIFSILAFCLISAVFALVLGQYKKEYSAIISVGAASIIFVSVISSIASPLTEVVNKLQSAGVDVELFFVALKALGIGYITQFVADTCRDFGQTSLAAKAEFIGRVSIFIISLPLANTLFDAVVSLVGQK